jgi:hypothetical protein
MYAVILIAALGGPGQAPELTGNLLVARNVTAKAGSAPGTASGGLAGTLYSSSQAAR